MLKEQRPTPPLNQTGLQAVWPAQTSMPGKQGAPSRGEQSTLHFSSLWTIHLFPPHTWESFSNHRIAVIASILSTVKLERNDQYHSQQCSVHRLLFFGFCLVLFCKRQRERANFKGYAQNHTPENSLGGGSLLFVWQK